MGVSKSHEFSKYQNQIAALAKAIAHPARVAILEILITKQDCICNDIVDELPLAQATISQHLKELKQAGIIKGTVTGKALCYCVDNNYVDLLKNFLNHLTIKNIKCNC